jgi:hypothetical protein
MNTDSPSSYRNYAADLDEHLPAIQEVDVATRNCRIREQTVDKHENERRKYQVMKLSPQWASHAQAKKMARSSECTDWCAQKVLDGNDIVREAILQQLPIR